jgi:Tol biopolymer transport system component
MTAKEKPNIAIWVALITGVLALCGTIIAVVAPPFIEQLLRDTPTSPPPATVSPIAIPQQTATAATPDQVPTETIVADIDTFTPISPTNTPLPQPTIRPFGGGGQRIAFVGVSTVANNLDTQIYTMNLNGTERKQLTSDGNNDSPAWSPDGKKIVFRSTRDDPNPKALAANREIYVMNEDGSEQTRLTFDDMNKFNPAWSPNGQYIAFSAGGEIYVSSVNGSAPIQLTLNDVTDDYPSWSPDSAQIAFASQNGIYVMNVSDGSGQRQLTSTAGDTQPSWSPDGKYIAYCASAQQGSPISLMDPNGGGNVRLTSNSAYSFGPQWSPDSKLISYFIAHGNASDFYVISTDGTLVKTFVDIPGISPIWQP